MYLYFSAAVAGVVLQSVVGLSQQSSVLLSIVLIISVIALRRVDCAAIRAVFVVIAGFCYAEWCTDNISAQQLPLTKSNEVAFIRAKVLSRHDLVSGERFVSRLTMQVVQATDYSGQPLRLGRIEIKAFAEAAMQVDAECSFYARLKSPVGKRNPGGTDQERALLRQRISAVGYVVEHPGNICEVRKRRFGFATLRTRISSALDQMNINDDTREALRALAIADRSAMTEGQWQVLRETGTSHLLAISGLHISLIASFAYFMVRMPMLLLLGRQHGQLGRRCALLASLVGAGFYAGVADFSLPTVRALIMVALSIAALVTDHQILSFGLLVSAALVVVLQDPLAPTLASFWLSFGAVGLLIVMRNVRPNDGWLLNSLRTHTFLSIGLLPILAVLNNTVPLGSPVANLIAVPLVGLAVVPLIVCGMVAVCIGLPIASHCWSLAAGLWDIIWYGLRLTSVYLPDITLSAQPEKLQICLAVVAVLAMLIPLFPRRWIFVCACLGQLLIGPTKGLKNGEYQLTILDVGQGLAVLVRTTNHVLVYDAGPSFGHYSAGLAVVIPALRYLGESKIDHLIISHGDNDHAGGLMALLGEFEVDKLSVSYSLPENLGAMRCHARQMWLWDGVLFEILSPPADAVNLVHLGSNNNSCVLKISAPTGISLLPGDIEQAVEQQLLSLNIALKADMLIAPHHGSSTSSSIEFIRSVDPDYVVFAAGFQNKFNFPNARVVERYQQNGANSFITSETGAINFNFKHSGVVINTARAKKIDWWFRGHESR